MCAVVECPDCGGFLSHAGSLAGSARIGEHISTEERQRIEELTREVRLLQRTVAQLRGHPAPLISSAR